MCLRPVEEQSMANWALGRFLVHPTPSPGSENAGQQSKDVYAMVFVSRERGDCMCAPAWWLAAACTGWFLQP